VQSALSCRNNPDYLLTNGFSGFDLGHVIYIALVIAAAIILLRIIRGITLLSVNNN